jgi:hypothetical protein
MNENRVHPRYAIELAATISDEKSGELRGRTRDLSRGGFCMLASQGRALGTVCHTTLALVFSETEFSEELVLDGIVVWCSQIGGVWQIGVKFMEVDEASAQYLNLFMRFLEEGDNEDDDV